MNDLWRKIQLAYYKRKLSQLQARLAPEADTHDSSPINREPPIDVDSLISKRVYKVEGMPESLDQQNEVACLMIQADAFHVKCANGSYYILVHDTLTPVNNIKIEEVPPGGLDWEIVMQILETGEADLSKKRGLKVIK